MGMIKKFLKVSFGYGVPIIVLLAVWLLLDPVTFWQVMITWILSIVVFIIIGLVTTTIADKW